MIRTTMTTAPSAASPATTCRMRSPKCVRRPVKGRRTVLAVVSTVLMPSVLLLDLLHSLLSRLDDELGQRGEDLAANRRLLRGSDRPTDEGPKQRCLRGALRDDDVREGRHHPRVPVLLRLRR